MGRRAKVSVYRLFTVGGKHRYVPIVRRIEPSPAFIRQFGRPDDTVITLDHPLGPVLPIGRKMTRPMSLSMTDLNYNQYEYVAEAFDTTWNVLILLYPVRVLTSTAILLPTDFEAHRRNQ